MLGKCYISCFVAMKSFHEFSHEFSYVLNSVRKYEIQANKIQTAEWHLHEHYCNLSVILSISGHFSWEEVMLKFNIQRI